MIAQSLVVVDNNLLKDVLLHHFLQRRCFKFTEKTTSVTFVFHRNYNVPVVVNDVTELLVSAATFNAVLALIKKTT